MLIQDILRNFQQQLLDELYSISLPSENELNKKTSKLQIKRYCCLRMLYNVAECMINQPQWEDKELIEGLPKRKIHLLSEKDIIALCKELIEIKREYSDGIVFRCPPITWSGLDIARTLLNDNEGSYEKLLNAINLNPIMKAPQYKTTANGKTEVHDFTYLPAVTSMLDTLQHHDLTMENIYQISLWKVDRYPQLDYLTLDALNSVKNDTNLDVAKTRDILEKLLNTQGVGLPMASAYLRFINPQVYQIIDHRAYRAAFDYKEPLHANDSVKNLCDTYIKYLEKLQGIAANGYHGISVTFEDLDRFLYDVDKKAGYTVNMPLKDINRDLWEDVVKNLGGKFTRYLLSKADLESLHKTNH